MAAGDATTGPTPPSVPSGPPSSSAVPSGARAGRVREVAALFTRLGFTAFGGPAAHVALMEDEVVRRRGWIDRRHFLDLVALLNFIPGPNSTELAIHLGYHRAGYPGLLVAGACFILPAVVIVLPLAWAYVTFGSLPQVQGLLRGIGAVMVGIVAVTLWRLGRTAVRDKFTAAVAIGAAAAAFWFAGGFAGRVDQPELVILAAAAAAGALWYGRPSGGQTSLASVGVPLLVGAWSPASAFPTDVWRMALFFLKVGATLYGSGYVLISFLQSGLVDREPHWLTRQQLLDAVAVGQVTPGPLLTTATFIGYLLGAGRFGGGVPGGVAGGLVATAAIFLPSFVFVALLAPVLPRLRENRYARGALDGMSAAAAALILVVTLRLAATLAGDYAAVILSAAAVVALLRWNVNPTWLVLAGAVLGLTRQLAGGY